MIEEAWIGGLIGGLLIGTASAAYLLLDGRIAGISGILGGLVGGTGCTLPARAAFLAGLAGGPLAVAWLVPGQGMPDISLTPSVWLLVAGGLLVGIGTRLGNGCTSGHGVCGLSRGSRRSMVAVAVFMGVAAVTLALARHVFDLPLPGLAP